MKVKKHLINYGRFSQNQLSPDTFNRQSMFQKFDIVKVYQYSYYFKKGL